MITQVDEDAMGWLDSGDKKYFSGDLDGAMVKYETVILAKESNLSPYVLANAHYNIAMVHFEEDNYKMAANSLNDCISLLQEYQDRHNRLHAPAMSLHKFAHVLLKEIAEKESEERTDILSNDMRQAVEDVYPRKRSTQKERR